MKKIVLLIVACAVTAGMAVASPVERVVAHRVAVNFWNTHRPVEVRAVESLQPIEVSGLQHLYVFASGQQGFVIVSADDCVRPVLGYSFEDPATEEANPEVRYWLSWMDRQIAAWDGVQQAADPRWGQLLTGSVPAEPQPLTAYVANLCDTKWDQGAPFNSLCPYDSVYYDRAVVGCVATAMAQIMKRWNHPSCGTGSHEYHHHFMSDYGYDYGDLSADFGNTTYMWQDMPSTANSGTSAKASAALSTLSYHCGVSVDMMYGTTSHGGSGAYTSCGWWATACAEQAFSTYFKYKPTATYHARSEMTDKEWLAMIDDELASGRPIYYDGSDTSSGHAFVLDGANSDSAYHFNWGWSGTYNGYYTVNNLAPTSGGIGSNATHSFNMGQGVIVGIEPDVEPMDTVTIVDNICTNYKEYPFYDYMLAVKSTDTLLRHLDTVLHLTLTVEKSNFATFNSNSGGFGSTEDVEYCRFDGLTMPECNFTKKGYFFVGWGKKKSGSENILYQPGDVLDTMGNVVLYARWQDTNKAAIIDVEGTSLSVWPNPAADVLHVQIAPEGDGTAYVIDALGRRLMEAPVRVGKAEIDVHGLPAGLYLVQVCTVDGIYNQRIIKQ